MSTKSFKELNVWQKSYDLTLLVYKYTSSFPESEKYGITSQIRRASVSVCSNIAEGYGRMGVKEKGQFYSIAHGSLTEVENQLMICHGIGYMKKEDLDVLLDFCVEIEKMLSRLQTVNKEKGVK